MSCEVYVQYYVITPWAQDVVCLLYMFAHLESSFILMGRT